MGNIIIHKPLVFCQHNKFIFLLQDKKFNLISHILFFSIFFWIRFNKNYLPIIYNIINKMGDKVVFENKDDAVDKIDYVLKNSNHLTITEIVDRTKISRSAIRTALAKLDGAGKVSVRKIGMAKVYHLNKKNKK